MSRSPLRPVLTNRAEKELRHARLVAVFIPQLLSSAAAAEEAQVVERVEPVCGLGARGLQFEHEVA
jgi:hypothetical protein